MARAESSVRNVLSRTFLNGKFKKAQSSLELERSENCPCLYTKEILLGSCFRRRIAQNSEDSSCLHLDGAIQSSAKAESNTHQKFVQMEKILLMENRSSQGRKRVG